MTRVKICGLTNLADAQFAADCGADFLGFVFYPPSPRYVSPEQAREIVQSLKFKVQSSKSKVQGSRSKVQSLKFKVQSSRFKVEEAKTLNIKPETLNLTPETLNLPPETLNIKPETLKPRLVGVFVNQSADFIRHTLDECRLNLAQLHGDEPAEFVAQFGGRAFKAVNPQSLAEAETAAEEFIIQSDGFILLDAFHPTLRGGSGLTADWDIAAHMASRRKILLAGGLTPENVTQAVQAVAPWAVDVSSGVEASKGRKDPEKVKAFIQAVQAADGKRQER